MFLVHDCGNYWRRSITFYWLVESLPGHFRCHFSPTSGPTSGWPLDKRIRSISRFEKLFLAILSDACHMFTDLSSFILSLIALSLRFVFVQIWKNCYRFQIGASYSSSADGTIGQYNLSLERFSQSEIDKKALIWKPDHMNSNFSI